MREMKDSGILGVGTIPSNWSSSRLNYECYIRARLGWRGLKAEEYVDGGYAFISAFNIQDGKLVWEPLNYITKERYDESPEIKLSIGDVLLVKDGAGVGKSARVDELPFGGTAPNSSVGVITPNTLLSYRYVCYYLQSPVFSNFVGLLYNGMGVPHLTQEVLKAIKIPMPPIDEQNNIADFLDSKCAEIDALSADIQSEIDTLEAYKRSVITEAVTKGLDKNVPMKDSGIEWAEKVPAHWKVMQNKYIMKKVKEICPVYNNEDILSLTMNGVIVRDLDAGGKMPASFNGYQIIHPGNLLMCLFDYDVTPRCIGLIKNEGLTSPAYSQFVMKHGNTAEYYYYYYLMIDFTKELLHLAKNLRHSFTEDQLGMINAPVPPIGEQIAIAKYLDEQCAEIDSIIAQKQEQLAVLADYKKSVIFEYVTGKKEVPVA